ncbi:hypothetical protein GF373_17665 [bacterium]|nr:hypothetical protein [bacterium]
MYFLEAKGEFVKTTERILFRDLAKEVAERFDSRPMFVNIGVSWGATLHCLRAGAPGAKLIGIDIDLEHRKLHGDPKAILIEGDSNTLCARFGSKIHFLLVDGGHDYDTVKNDIIGWTPKVVPGGVVAFHDYTPLPGSIRHEPCLVGVKQAVDELLMGNEEWTEIDRAISSIAFQKNPR